MVSDVVKEVLRLPVGDFQQVSQTLVKLKKWKELKILLNESTAEKFTLNACLQDFLPNKKEEHVDEEVSFCLVRFGSFGLCCVVMLCVLFHLDIHQLCTLKT